MKNTFINKYIILFLSSIFCFLFIPRVYGIDNGSGLNYEPKLECDNGQYFQEKIKEFQELGKVIIEWLAEQDFDDDKYSQEEIKKLEEFEKILLKWSEYSDQNPDDIDNQYEFYKRTLNLARELGIVT